MTPFTSLLATTDFSIEGNNAVHRAALLAQAHGARLKVVHVLDPDGRRPWPGWLSPPVDIELAAAQARESLHRFAVELAGRYDIGASVEVMVAESLETLRLASERAELVILGRCGRSRFGRTVDRLLGTCRRPVLVVKTRAERAYRRVLVPVDFTAPSDAAVRLAARLVRDGRMHVFHAINSHREAVLRDSDVPEHVIRESRLRQEAGTLVRMRRKVASLGLDSTRMDFAVAHGHPVWSTLSQAHSLRADLIVAGKEGRSTLGEFLLGSVSRSVLAGSACDMLIVPRPRKDHLAHAASAQMRLPGPVAQADPAALANTGLTHCP